MQTPNSKAPRIRLSVEPLEDRSTPATISIAQASYTVAENAGSVTVTVERTGDTTGSETINYATTDGTALVGRDYAAPTTGSNNTNQPLTGSLSFAAGQTSLSRTIRILDNAQLDPVRTLTFTLSGFGGTTVAGANTTATISITDFETGRPVVTGNLAVNESAGTATVTVNRVGGSSGTLSVNYATVDGTAVAGVDYEPTAGVLTWGPGETAPQSINVTLNNTEVADGTRTFGLNLGNTALGTSSVTAASAWWTFDNDTIQGPLNDRPVIRDQGTNGLNLVNSSRALGGSTRGSHRFTQPAPFTLTRSDGTTETSIVNSGATFPGAGQAYELQSGIAKILVGANITGASWDGPTTTATYTTQTPHNLQLGQRIQIGGSTNANHGITQSSFTGLFTNVITTLGANNSFNGVMTVTGIVNGTTFTTTVTTDPGSYLQGTGALNATATQGPIWRGTATILAAPVTTNSQTTITVTSNDGFPVGSPFRPFYIQLGNGTGDSATELAQVTAVNGTTWTIRRNVSAEIDGQSKPNGLWVSPTTIVLPSDRGWVTLVTRAQNGVVDLRNGNTGPAGAPIQGRTAYRDLLAPFPTDTAGLPTGLASDARFFTNTNLNSLDGTISYSFWLNMPELVGSDFNPNRYISNFANRTVLIGRTSDPSQGGNFGGVVQVRTVPHYQGTNIGVTVQNDTNGNPTLLTGFTSTAAFRRGSAVSGAAIPAGTTVAEIVNANTLRLTQAATVVAGTSTTVDVNTGYDAGNPEGTVKYTFELRMDNTGTPSGATERIPFNVAFTVGEWNHFVITYDRLATRVYKNGVLVDSLSNIRAFDPGATGSTNKGVIYESNGAFRLNQVGYNGASFQEGGNFQIDDLGVFRSALTDADVRAIYQKGLRAAQANVATLSILDDDAPSIADIRVRFGSQSYSLIGNTRILPWTNIRVIEVVFTQDVVVDAADLKLNGVTVALYGGSFTYNSGTRTATFTLASPFSADRLTLNLDGTDAGADGNDGIRNLNGAYLNGGNFQSQFDVLPGDFSGDGVVTLQDSILVRNQVQLGQYNLFADFDGDVVLSLADINAPRRRLGSQLP